MVSPALVLADDLPPPPTEMSAIAEATLYLDLVVNQMPRVDLIPVQQRAGRLYLDSDLSVSYTHLTLPTILLV